MVGAQLVIDAGVTTWLKANPPPQSDGQNWWRPGDSAIICDGTNCITVKWVANSSFFVVTKLPTPDSGNYKNQKKKPALGTPALRGAIYPTIHGHWETRQYFQTYSDGSQRVYFEEQAFIVDYISFSFELAGGLPKEAEVNQ